jgi:hypothetical protein
MAAPRRTDDEDLRRMIREADAADDAAVQRNLGMTETFDRDASAARANPYNRPDPAPMIPRQSAPPQRGADLRGGDLTLRRGRPGVMPQQQQLTPQEQQLVDSAWDITDRATYIDEGGRRRARPQFLPDSDTTFEGQGQRRYLAEEAERERQAAIDEALRAYNAQVAKMKRAPRRI